MGVTKPTALLPRKSVEIGDDYQSGAELPRSKGSADLFYAHASYTMSCVEHRRAHAMLPRLLNRLFVSGVDVADDAHPRIGRQHAL